MREFLAGFWHGLQLFGLWPISLVIVNVAFTIWAMVAIITVYGVWATIACWALSIMAGILLIAMHGRC